MKSIYIILVAMYLFKIAENINRKFDKANFYKGLLVVGSWLFFLASFVCLVIK